MKNATLSPPPGIEPAVLRFPVQRSIANCATKSNCRKRATKFVHLYILSVCLVGRMSFVKQYYTSVGILLFVFSTSYFPFNNHVCKINGKSTIFYCGLKHPNRRDNITHYKKPRNLLILIHACTLYYVEVHLYILYSTRKTVTPYHTPVQTQHETTQRMRGTTRNKRGTRHNT